MIKLNCLTIIYTGFHLLAQFRHHFATKAIHTVAQYCLLTNVKVSFLKLKRIIRNRTMSHIKKTEFDPKLKQKIIQICEDKIRLKGDNVGLSFYAFFANKNDDPDALMQVATWWIQTHQLDHFEKAIKIKQLILDGK